MEHISSISTMRLELVFLFLYGAILSVDATCSLSACKLGSPETEPSACKTYDVYINCLEGAKNSCGDSTVDKFTRIALANKIAEATHARNATAEVCRITRPIVDAPCNISGCALGSPKTGPGACKTYDVYIDCLEGAKNNCGNSTVDKFTRIVLASKIAEATLAKNALAEACSNLPIVDAQCDISACALGSPKTGPGACKTYDVYIDCLEGAKNNCGNATVDKFTKIVLANKIAEATLAKNAIAEDCSNLPIVDAPCDISACALGSPKTGPGACKTYDVYIDCLKGAKNNCGNATVDKFTKIVLANKIAEATLAKNAIAEDCSNLPIVDAPCDISACALGSPKTGPGACKTYDVYIDCLEGAKNNCGNATVDKFTKIVLSNKIAEATLAKNAIADDCSNLPIVYTPCDISACALGSPKTGPGACKTYDVYIDCLEGAKNNCGNATVDKFTKIVLANKIAEATLAKNAIAEDCSNLPIVDAPCDISACALGSPKTGPGACKTYDVYIDCLEGAKNNCGNATVDKFTKIVLANKIAEATLAKNAIADDCSNLPIVDAPCDISACALGSPKTGPGACKTYDVYIDCLEGAKNNCGNATVDKFTKIVLANKIAEATLAKNAIAEDCSNLPIVDAQCDISACALGSPKTGPGACKTYDVYIDCLEGAKNNCGNATVDKFTKIVLANKIAEATLAKNAIAEDCSNLPIVDAPCDISACALGSPKTGPGACKTYDVYIDCLEGAKNNCGNATVDKFAEATLAKNAIAEDCSATRLNLSAITLLLTLLAAMIKL